MKTTTFTAPSGARIRFTRLGFGSAPLGNLYKAISEEQARDTLETAWKAGMRYFDTAPLYGLGLSETRINHFLRGKKRADYIVSTKVGRLLQACAPKERTGIGKFFATPSRREVYDYGYDGVMRPSRRRWSGSGSIPSKSCSCMTSMSSTTGPRPPATRGSMS